MAKITSRSSLNVGTEIVIDETARTIRLVEAGNLVAKDGVTLQAVYSKLVDLWAVSSYQDSPFPMYSIDALSGQFQIGTDGRTYSGWNWYDDTTRNMLRDGGWSEYSAAGVLEQQFAGFVGLGTITPATTVQPYYHLASTDAPTNFPFTDQFNVGVKVFGDATHGNFDKRTYAKTFVREYGKKFKSSILADTGATGTGAFKVNFLIANEDDLKITTLLGAVQATGDAAMAGSPYTGVTVSYYTANQTRTIAGVSRDFKIIISNSAGATLEQIYAKVQYLLRQNSDINTSGDAGTKTGKIQSDLLSFVGDTLVTAQSVYIDDVISADSNRVEFYDDSNTKRTNLYTAAGTMSFNSVLVGAGSSYRLMFTAPPGGGNDYGEAGAITVNDASGDPITGTISAGSIAFDYDYDGNTQGGYSGGTERPVTLIGIRPGYGKFAVATGTLTRSKTIALSLVAEQDRVYA
ncbi:MAG TPA: hypothetical protein PLL30_17595 [Candidatus Krumholzibacteria bacterium]|nr:hypothetical protein [Candidatus Krumholzibacteria bacterium]HPD73592.1 hypothetical protein [Candidatus Krumholzibacteria bacterium]HRY42276.1 hypothetical protein [Candidatus Krumholzibacteria bacterium]